MASVVWLMVIAFWMPGTEKPIMVSHGSFENEELCYNEAHRLDMEWAMDISGGSTSFICVGAFPAPSKSEEPSEPLVPKQEG